MEKTCCVCLPWVYHVYMNDAPRTRLIDSAPYTPDAHRYIVAVDFEDWNLHIDHPGQLVIEAPGVRTSRMRCFTAATLARAKALAGSGANARARTTGRARVQGTSPWCVIDQLAGGEVVHRA